MNIDVPLRSALLGENDRRRRAEEQHRRHQDGLSRVERLATATVVPDIARPEPRHDDGDPDVPPRQPAWEKL